MWEATGLPTGHPLAASQFSVPLLRPDPISTLLHAHNGLLGGFPACICCGHPVPVAPSVSSLPPPIRSEASCRSSTEPSIRGFPASSPVLSSLCPSLCSLFLLERGVWVPGSCTAICPAATFEASVSRLGARLDSRSPPLPGGREQPLAG